MTAVTLRLHEDVSVVLQDESANVELTRGELRPETGRRKSVPRRLAAEMEQPNAG